MCIYILPLRHNSSWSIRGKRHPSLETFYQEEFESILQHIPGLKPGSPVFYQHLKKDYARMAKVTSKPLGRGVLPRDILTVIPHSFLILKQRKVCSAQRCNPSPTTDWGGKEAANFPCPLPMFMPERKGYSSLLPQAAAPPYPCPHATGGRWGKQHRSRVFSFFLQPSSDGFQDMMGRLSLKIDWNHGKFSENAFTLWLSFEKILCSQMLGEKRAIWYISSAFLFWW